MRRLRFVLAFLACVRVCAPSELAAQFQKFHRRLFDYTPSGPINVLMHDLWHYGNAGASPIPENHITIGIEPYAHDYESAPAPERMTSSLNHEMAHIVTVDKATASDRFYRSLFFGKVTPNPEVPLSMLYGYLTTPRWYAPRWYLEGIAVYLETWMNGGLGRAIGPYDEMVFRTLVRDSGRIFDFVGLESEGTTIDFQVGANSYLYGTRFISYLGLRYGHDSLIAWYNRAEGSRRYFSTQFRHVYGRSLEDDWSRWIAWERDWQETNLAAIRGHPVTAFRPLTDHALGSVSRAYYDSTSRAIYVGIRYPDVTDPVLYHRQRRLAEPLRPGPGDRPVTGPAPERADRRSRLRSGGPVAVGRQARQWVLDAGPPPPALSRVEPDPDAAVRDGPVRPGHVAGRLDSHRIHVGDQREPEAGADGRRGAAGARGHARGPVRFR